MEKSKKLLKGFTALYARVSSEDQADNHSIFGQLHAGNELAKRFELENIKEYIDNGYSARSLKRPYITELIKDIKKGIIINLIIDDWDRFTRSVADGDKLVKLLVKMDIDVYETKSGGIVNLKTADSRLFVMFKSAMAQHYSEKVSEKTIGGLMGGLQQGSYTISKAPFGYKKNINKKDIVDREERKKAVVWLIPIKEEIDLIIEIFEWYTIDLLSILDIHRKLKDTEYPLSQQKISRILNNQKYTGEFIQNGELFKGYGLEEIITKEMYEVAKARLCSCFKSKKYDYIFYKKVKCNICGEYLTCKPTKKKNNKVYLYYECSNPDCNCSKRINQDNLIYLLQENIINLYNKHTFTFYHPTKEINRIKSINHLPDRVVRDTIVRYMKPQSINLIESTVA